jgi:translation elongation factor EF-Ts
MTGAGLMDCKAALAETGGDFENAIDFLRKKGAKIAAKRADRDATEGVFIKLHNNSNGQLIHLFFFHPFVESLSSANRTIQKVILHLLVCNPISVHGIGI